MRDPVPMSMGDVGRFQEVEKEVRRLLDAGNQSQHLVESYPARLTLRALIDGHPAGATHLFEPTLEALRTTDPRELAADFVDEMRGRQLARQSGVFMTKRVEATVTRSRIVDNGNAVLVTYRTDDDFLYDQPFSIAGGGAPRSGARVIITPGPEGTVIGVPEIIG